MRRGFALAGARVNRMRFVRDLRSLPQRLYHAPSSAAVARGVRPLKSACSRICWPFRCDPGRSGKCQPRGRDRCCRGDEERWRRGYRNRRRADEDDGAQAVTPCGCRCALGTGTCIFWTPRTMSGWTWRRGRGVAAIRTASLPNGGARVHADAMHQLPL